MDGSVSLSSLSDKAFKASSDFVPMTSRLPSMVGNVTGQTILYGVLIEGLSDVVPGWPFWITNGSR
jgi:hypothetical protein